MIDATPYEVFCAHCSHLVGKHGIDNGCQLADCSCDFTYRQLLELDS